MQRVFQVFLQNVLSYTDGRCPASPGPVLCEQKGSSTLNRFGANLFRTMNKLAHSPVVTLVVGSITSFFPSPTAAQTLAIGADNPMLAGQAQSRHDH